MIFKESWALKILATIAAGIKSKDEKYEDFNDLHNSKLSLCKRVRCARMKSGNSKYWEILLSSEKDLNFTLLVLFTWGTPKNIIQLLPLITKVLEDLESHDFDTLIKALKSTVSNSYFSKLHQTYLIKAFKEIEHCDKIKYLLSFRFDNKNNTSFVYDNIKNFTGMMHTALEAKLRYIISEFLNDPSNNKFLTEMKNTYKSLKDYNIKNQYFYHNIEMRELPYDIAKLIMTEAKNFPKIITILAEKSCTLYANNNVKPIGEIAKNNNWFE